MEGDFSVPTGLRVTAATNKPGGREIPPGWSRNPTAWPKRIGLAAVALIGLLVAGYLTLYQIDVFSRVWDPFFPHGTPIVTHLTDPFPDAALGVLAYGAEIVLSFIGGRSRWRTMPWTVIAFGVVIFSGAGVSMVLMIIQPTVAGAWCTLCLASALISLILCGWGADEPLAALQHLGRVRREGGSPWRAFWGLEDTRTLSGAPRKEETRSAGSRVLGAGITFGARMVGVVFGAWLMAAPQVIGYSDTPAGLTDYITGPVLLVVSFLALWPALRVLRWLELPLAAWIFVTPFFLEYAVNDNMLPEILHICMALILFGTAFLGGETRENFGGGWPSVLPFLKRETKREL